MSVRLPVRRVEKPWGRERLPAPFDEAGDTRRIGEIWFEPTELTDRLLAKILFTSERLSVQVHPADETSPTAGTLAVVMGSTTADGRSTDIPAYRTVTRSAVRAITSSVSCTST